MPRFYSLISYFLIHFYVLSQQGVEFKHLKLNNSNSPIYCITKDNMGFMWFGNDEGIVKYDGYKSKTYTPKEFNDYDFVYVWKIAVDIDNLIWVGTSKGLFRFDPSTEKFTHIMLDSVNSPANKAWIVGLYNDSNGNIWIAIPKRIPYHPIKYGRFVAK